VEVILYRASSVEDSPAWDGIAGERGSQPTESENAAIRTKKTKMENAVRYIDQPEKLLLSRRAFSQIR
jgi:hypothetical protein